MRPADAVQKRERLQRPLYDKNRQPMPLQDVDLKKTVNLPRTDFPMKANLPQAEPKLLARWNEMGIYAKIRESRAGRPRYVLHDGPPYANGNIHLGHAFNKVLKDFIVKSKTMAGYDSPYIPGWDCHGLPIELKVDGQLGSKKAQMTTAQIRSACRKYAEKYVELQKRDFMRLGVFGRWDDPYLTMSAHYQSVIAGAFVDFLDRGYVYKGLKPVHWCLNDRTALAEAEVEYENHSSPSIWVRFPLVSDPGKIDPALAGRRLWGLIWTTTPWTIPANMAIAFHPKFDYSAVAVGGDVYLIADALIEETASKCGWADVQKIVTFPGSKLEGVVFRHPFLERDSPGILADHVTLDQGTGAVHTAPGHGHEDFVIGRQYGIETYCPVGADGRFFHVESPVPGRLPDSLIGKTVWEANPVVIELLTGRGALLAQKTIQHSYPHCWRCHKPTIFRATEQWFIGMERNDLRARALEAIRKVKWMPAWGEERIYNMIATRPDWCISRQRIWGVPIIVFYCEKCGMHLTDRKVLDRVVQLFAEHTADVWYQRPAAELVGDAKCQSCGGSEFRKETDILDVWFDSGSSHLAVLTKENDLDWPSDMYLEGGDQYRGWFHSSLLVGVGLRGQAPYRESATNGWTLDGEGRAMSKSLGIGIEPEEIIKQYGADVLRLWVSSVEFTEDVRLSDTILTRLTEAYRKLRNTFRWALGNLHGFDPERDALPVEQLREIDRWILVRAEELVRNCRAWYEEYAFHRVYQALYNFATTDLSAVYFDVLKDRLYTSATRSTARRSAQTALWRVTDALVRLMSPVLAFTTEEVWTHFHKPKGAAESIHMEVFPEPAQLTEGLSSASRARLENWTRLMEVRELVLKSLEVARQSGFIGAPLEAKVHLKAQGDLYELLREYAGELPALFIVSQVELRPGDDIATAVHVERADGVKCERCWKYTTDVGSYPDLPTVCAACAAAVVEMLDPAVEVPAAKN
jgi:isoleucyl-tRNA synthetase